MRRCTLVAIVALATTLLSGCYDWNAAVRSQASFDHDCPEDQVEILRDNGDGMARAVWVDVCGTRRIYRDIGGSRVFLWQDMTEAQGSGGEAD